MNDAELLIWVERQSYYSLQRIIVEFGHNQDFLVRLRHLRCLFPEAFPRLQVEDTTNLHSQFVHQIKEQK